MEWIFIIVFFVIILYALSPGETRGHNYQLRKALFTPAERSFLGVIESAVSDDIRVFGKVRIADVLTPKKGLSRKNWQIAFNKISAKHFDYLLCDVGTLEVIAVIELDDKSHNSSKAKERDRIIESACTSAGLDLIRFKAKSRYHIDEVKNQIDNSIYAEDKV